MHELAIATGLVDLIKTEVEKRGLSKVTEVKLVVGELTNVVPEALEFCFEVASQETAAAGAKLIIEPRPIMAHCQACDADFPVKNYSFICPVCGSGETKQTGGNELYVDHLIAD